MMDIIKLVSSLISYAMLFVAIFCAVTAKTWKREVTWLLWSILLLILVVSESVLA